MIRYFPNRNRTFLLFAVLFLSLQAQSLVSQSFYDVTEHGIVPEGKNAIARSVNQLITTVSEEGGGTIYFPAGEYLLGPIHLKSNITLYLDAGSIIYFSDNFNDYLPMVPSRFEGIDVVSFSPLIYAYEAENITITGRGKLDGQGKKWWDFHHELYSKPADYESEWQKEFLRQNEGMTMPDIPFMYERGFCRPPFIQPMYCNNIKIEGVTIVNSPFWTVNPEYCENVTVSGVTIINPESPNTDGINPESCRNVHISDCHISVGDDCITIKAGKDLPGRMKAAPAENYTITNCTMLSGHGGVVIGSEMSGGVRNIAISNCIFGGTDRGIRIKSTRGRGGVVEDIRVSNIVVRNIKKEVIKMNLRYSKTEPEPVSERTPVFRNIDISNVSGDAYQAIVINGLEEMPVQDISFSDINIESKYGVDVNYASGIVFDQVHVKSTKSPEFLIRNSNKIHIGNVIFSNAFNEIPCIRLQDIEACWIHSCSELSGERVLLDISGAKTKAIYTEGNLLPNSDNQVRISSEVKNEEIILQ